MLYNPMTHGAHASLYNPMTHGDLYLLYNIVWPHDPWGFVTIAAPMTHGEKVAEGALEGIIVLCTVLRISSQVKRPGSRCCHQGLMQYGAGSSCS